MPKSGIIILDGRRAVGVALRDREVRLREGGEVILSGGAVNTPLLLMRSGVGPGAELRQHGVEVVHDAPEVGGNLADHLDVACRSRQRDALRWASRRLSCRGRCGRPGVMPSGGKAN